MYGGHDGDAEVDQPSLVAHAEAAVLRHAALGDVQLAHDLDAGEDRLVVLARDGRHCLLEDAVDAILHHQAVVAGFEVDVRGATLQRGEDGGVHQADDGRDVVLAGETLDGDVLVRAVVAGEHVEGQALACLVQHTLRLLGLFQKVGDLRHGGDAGDQPLAQQAGDLVQHHQLRWIADRNGEAALKLFQRDKVVAEHQIDRHTLE